MNKEERKEVCLHCGTVFIKRYKNSTQKYCSWKCHKAETVYINKCVICDDVFTSKVINTKYCKKCRTRKCERCGKEFILKNSEVKGNQYNVPKKYCSSHCFYSARKGIPACNKEEGINIICQNCGKIFNVWKSRIERDVKYCTKECMNEARSKITGKSHPLWKGGHDLYGYMLSKNEGSFYRNRKIVLKRDNNTCQFCGDKRISREMDVHHIKSVIEGGESTLLNMVTLCRKCHNHADKGKIASAILKDKTLKVA